MKKLVLKRPPRSTVSAVLGKDFSGKSVFAEVELMRRHLEGLDDFGVRGLWKDLIDSRRDISEQPRWLLCLGIEYQAQMSGYVRVSGRAPDMVERRSRLAAALDRAGLRKESDFLTDDYREGSGGDKMSKNKERREKERRAGRVTASSVLIPLLSRDSVPADDKIIEEVREKTGHSKFDAKQLAWYKWKYRQGKLKGQDGKQHVIEQGDNKKPAAKAKAKKKLVVKKKKKKEAVSA